jgi:hypothetical protein
MVLATICTALALHLGLGPGNSATDDDFIDFMGAGEENEIESDEREASKLVADDNTTPPSSSFGRQTTAGTQSTKRELKGAEAVEYRQLVNVYRAFCILKEFDRKFRKIWA